MTLLALLAAVTLTAHAAPTVHGVSSTGHAVHEAQSAPDSPRRAAAMPAVVRRVQTRQRVVAITIDDGGDPGVCRRMANILRREDVAATFFIIGRYVAAAPRLWRRIARRFPVANHTMFHALLPPLSDERIARQIGMGAQTIARVTGRRALPYLRPPGGAYDDRVRAIAASRGVRTLVLWDTTSADTAPNSRPSGMVRAALRGGPGSIVLMHCNRSLSARILPLIIEGYRERGFDFVTIPQLLGHGSAGKAGGSREGDDPDVPREAASGVYVPPMPGPACGRPGAGPCPR